jgi:hypothetical protein
VLDHSTMVEITQMEDFNAVAVPDIVLLIVALAG